jgi:benzoate transport
MADIRAELQQRPMNGFQIFVVAVMVFLNGLDGFDVLAMTFAGTVLRPEWGISAATFGWLISAGLIGMMAGSLLIAPFADKYGRRTLTLIALVLVTVGMFASAFTTGPWQMGFFRLVTGLGIGTMLASIASFTAEYSNARQRSLMISIMAIGYPAGGTFGGMVAAALVASTGSWEPIFIFGGICSLLVIPLIWFFIPDSLDFLITRKPKNALTMANKLLPKLGLSKVSALPDSEAHEKDVKIYTVLFRNHFTSTVKITLTYVLFAWVLYFALGWLPGMLTEAGLTATQGISGSVVLNAGGVVGGILFGMIAGKWGGLRNTIPFFMVLGFVFFVAFGFAPVDLGLMMALGAALGFCLIAIVSGLYSTYPVIFPPTVRTTGTGIVIGIGRIGGILSPIVAGYMIDADVGRGLLCVILAAPLLLALILLRSIPELKSPAARGQLKPVAAH